jgi:hypothetical protein
MAAGDIIWFQQAYVDTDKALHDKENDTFKMGIVDNSTVPAVGTADPRWGAGGTTNFASNQVTPGGNYPDGGLTLANPTVSLASGKSRFDADDVAMAQAAGNPSGAYWGIVYNDTDAGKRALCAIDLGGPKDFAAGPFSFAPNASGLSETGAGA